MTAVRYPSLYQINTRAWLMELSRTLGRPATLDDIPDGELDRLAQMGFDWIWLLSVWQTGPAGQRVSRATSAGGRNSRKRWRTCARRTLAAPASRSPGTRYTRCWAETPPWPGCASASAGAGCG